MVVKREDILKQWKTCQEELQELYALVENHRAGKYTTDLKDIGQAMEKIQTMVQMEDENLTEDVSETKEQKVYARALEIQGAEGLEYREALIMAYREFEE